MSKLRCGEVTWPISDHKDDQEGCVNNLDTGLAASEACAVSLYQCLGGTHMPAHTGEPQPTTGPYSGSLAWFKNFSNWSLFTKMKSQPSVKWAPLEKTLVDPQNPEGSYSNPKTVLNNEQWWRSSTKQDQSQCLVYSFHRHLIPSLTEWR